MNDISKPAGTLSVSVPRGPDLRITADKILQLNKWMAPDRAKDVADGLENARAIASLNSPRRVRQFMAQLAHESDGFNRLIESFFYKDPARLDEIFGQIKTVDQAKALIAKGPDAIANCVYANRLGNGDEASGDGSKYKGRGWIQITGKYNYAEAAKYSNLPLVDQPGLAGRPKEASIIAAQFWRWRNINDEADAGDLEGVTRKVNGNALQGLEDRKAWLLRCFKVWPG